jgi:hypothetical protein
MNEEKTTNWTEEELQPVNEQYQKELMEQKWKRLMGYVFLAAMGLRRKSCNYEKMFVS